MVFFQLFTYQSGDVWGKQCEKNRPWAFHTTFRTTVKPTIISLWELLQKG